MATRRELLKIASISGIAGAPVLTGCTAKPNTQLIGGYRKQGDSFGVACIHSDAELVWQFECAGRVHDIAIEPDLNLGAVAARRPGTFLQLFSALDGTKLDKISVPAGYQFEGHLSFMDQELWATASDVLSSKGILIRYRLDNLHSPEILALPGLGPHQILKRNPHEFWVAIGGWHTSNREVLNAESFESLLALVNISTNRIQTWKSPDPALGIRHLGVHEDQLVVGLQYANPKPSSAALVYKFDDENEWVPLATPLKGWEIFNGYIASVAISENWIAATSPRGHQVGLWQEGGQNFSGNYSLLDAAGTTVVNDEIWISSGTGQISQSRATSKQLSAVHWDNHWTSFNPNSELSTTSS